MMVVTHGCHDFADHLLWPQALGLVGPACLRGTVKPVIFSFLPFRWWTEVSLELAVTPRIIN